MKTIILTCARIILSTFLWLCVQLCVILTIEMLNLLPSNLFHIELYGIQGAIAWDCYTIACSIIGIVYTFVGSIILEKNTINTKKWWITIGVCYSLYMVLTACGMLAYMGEWFWEGYGVYLLDVWLAPLLWLAEIEIFYRIKTEQRKYNSDSSNPNIDTERDLAMD